MQDRHVRTVLVVVALAALTSCGLVVSLDGLEGPQRADTSADSSAAEVDAVVDAGHEDAAGDISADVTFSDGADGGFRPSPGCAPCFSRGERCCEHYGTAASCVALGAACGKDTVMNWGCFRKVGCGAEQACCIVEDFHDDSGPVGSPRRSECTKTPCLWPTGFGEQWRLCETKADCMVGEDCVTEEVWTGPAGAEKLVFFFHCKVP